MEGGGWGGLNMRMVLLVVALLVGLLADGGVKMVGRPAPAPCEVR